MSETVERIWGLADILDEYLWLRDKMRVGALQVEDATRMADLRALLNGFTVTSTEQRPPTRVDVVTDYAAMKEWREHKLRVRQGIEQPSLPVV